MTFVGDRARRATVRDAHAVLDGRRFRMNPVAGCVCAKHTGRLQDAVARMDAAATVEAQCDVVGAGDVRCAGRLGMGGSAFDSATLMGAAGTPRCATRSTASARGSSKCRCRSSNRCARRSRSLATSVRGTTCARRCAAAPSSNDRSPRIRAAQVCTNAPTGLGHSKFGAAVAPARAASIGMRVATSASRPIADISREADAASATRRSRGSGAGANTCDSVRIINA